MLDFDFVEFRNNIQKDLLDANQLIADIEVSEWNALYSGERDSRYNEETEFNRERLVDTFELIKLKFDFAYEFLKLEKMSNRLESELEAYKGKFGRLDFIPFVDVFYSPVKQILANHLDALTSHVTIKSKSEFENTTSFQLLEQILRGTSKMLTDRSVEPRNENEVRNEVYSTLIHVFPDTVREIPIAKVSKVYKPDIGIRRLKSAIEYKFADSLNEAKTAIGGIFEDIKGYAGSLDWTTFYAVIYMTDNYFTQDQVIAEWKLSGVPHEWKPIVLFGKGKRVVRKRAVKNNASLKRKSSK